MDDVVEKMAAQPRFGVPTGEIQTQLGRIEGYHRDLVAVCSRTWNRRTDRLPFPSHPARIRPLPTSRAHDAIAAAAYLRIAGATASRRPEPRSAARAA